MSIRSLISIFGAVSVLLCKFFEEFFVALLINIQKCDENDSINLKI